MGVGVPQEKVEGGAHGECAAGPRWEWTIVLDSYPMYLTVGREGGGNEAPLKEGFAQSAVELRLKCVAVLG